MTYHLSKTFPKKKIFSIEPLPSNLSILKRIIKDFKLKNVNLLAMAVGDKKDKVKMVLPVYKQVKMQGLAHIVHDSITEWNEGETISVNCETLDDLLGNEKVAAIKMDIENFEYFALKGAKNLLKTNQPVVYLELWANENRENCFTFLTQLGYKAYVSKKGMLELYNPAIHQKQNFIFICA